MSVRLGRVVVACLVLVASLGVAPASAVAEQPSAVSDDGFEQFDGDALSGLQETLQDIDEFLETVVDLVRTINELTGEGGE